MEEKSGLCLGRKLPEGRHILTLNSNGTIYVLRLEPPDVKK
jgi:hypothetical protein